MAALKLAPAVMGGWFVGEQRARGLAWMIAGGLLMTVVGIAGAGITGYLDYAGLVTTIPTSGMSVSYLTGIGWLSFALLLVGLAVSMSMFRWPRLAFVVGVATLVVASPTVYVTTFTLMLAALSPLLPDRTRSAGIAS